MKRLGIVGDGVADPKHHGGIDKAVCVYSADHFPYWREALGIEGFGAAAFGENLTVQGLVEDEVCVGDVWGLGSARVRVTQPRQPCWKLARRWKLKDLALRVMQNGFTGWYLRVLEEGAVEAGDAITRQERPHPEWTVARANVVMHHDKQDREATRELVGLEHLSGSWKEELGKRLTVA